MRECRGCGITIDVAKDWGYRHEADCLADKLNAVNRAISYLACDGNGTWSMPDPARFKEHVEKYVFAERKRSA